MGWMALPQLKARRRACPGQSLAAACRRARRGGALRTPESHVPPSRCRPCSPPLPCRRAPPSCTPLLCAPSCWWRSRRHGSCPPWSRMCAPLPRRPARCGAARGAGFFLVAPTRWRKVGDCARLVSPAAQPLCCKRPRARRSAQAAASVAPSAEAFRPAPAPAANLVRPPAALRCHPPAAHPLPTRRRPPSRARVGAPSTIHFALLTDATLPLAVHGDALLVPQDLDGLKREALQKVPAPLPCLRPSAPCIRVQPPCCGWRLSQRPAALCPEPPPTRPVPRACRSTRLLSMPSSRPPPGG